MLLKAPARIGDKELISASFLIPAFVLFVCVRAMGGAGFIDSGRQALVLGGGGPVGEAWESGIIAGLAEKGVDFSDAEPILGTSAGAIVGARLASRMPRADFMKAALAPSAGPPSGQPQQTSSGSPPDLTFLARKLEEMGSGERPQQSIFAEIGEWALKARPVVSEAQFVASYKRRFPEKHWPPQSFECVSVDATDGSVRVWNRSSAVPLPLAVASSCALPGVFAPVTINGRRYMDGGVRSVTNADLARGCKMALVLAPTIGPDDALAKSFTRPLNTELQTLRDSGCKVQLVVPDPASLNAFGATLGHENHRAPAFNAGLAEGRNKAGEIAKFWTN